MNIQELKSRPIEELRKLAKQYSLKPHHKHTAEKLAHMIVEHAIQKPPERDPMKHAATKPARPIYNNTVDEVLEAIKKFTAKEGYKTEFPGDNTWIFSYNGSEESGTLSQAMRIIVMKAESVSRGRRQLRGMKGDVVNGTYGDTILMV